MLLFISSGPLDANLILPNFIYFLHPRPDSCTKEGEDCRPKDRFIKLLVIQYLSAVCIFSDGPEDRCAAARQSWFWIYVATLHRVSP